MALLEVVGLKKTYPTGETALRGIDLAVDGAEVIAVLGLSGSGKSTLLRCINRLVEPSEGLVVLDGVRVSELDRRGLQRARRHMGMIFQEYNQLFLQVIFFYIPLLLSLQKLYLHSMHS